MRIVASPCAWWLACAAPLLMASAGVAVAQVQTSPDDRARSLAIEAGRETYRQFCAPCHGQDARGNGPVARLLLNPPVDLTMVSRRNNGEFPEMMFEAMLTFTRLQTAAHGTGQMPIWGPVFKSVDSSETLARARVVNLIAYLESIQR